MSKWQSTCYVTLHIHCLELKKLVEAEGTGAVTLSVPQSFLTDIKLLAIGNKNWALTLAQHDNQRTHQSRDKTNSVTKRKQQGRTENSTDREKASTCHKTLWYTSLQHGNVPPRHPRPRNTTRDTDSFLDAYFCTVVCVNNYSFICRCSTHLVKAGISSPW